MGTWVLAWRLCFPTANGALVFTTLQSHSVSRSAPIKAAVEAVVQASPRICGTHRAQHRSQVPWIIQRVLRDATIGLASPLTVLVHLRLGTVATMIIVSRR